MWGVLGKVTGNPDGVLSLVSRVNEPLPTNGSVVSEDDERQHSGQLSVWPSCMSLQSSSVIAQTIIMEAHVTIPEYM